MDNEDLTVHMGRDLPYMMTIIQAGLVVGVGRTTAHKLARQYRETGGAVGIPNRRVGRSLRVPRDELLDWIGRDRITPSPAAVVDELAPRRPVTVRRGGSTGTARAVRPRRTTSASQLPLFPAG